MPVFAWTINAPRQAVRLWQQGVRGVLSDDPEAVMRARDADARVQRSR
jgi:glycerophosphoryl diester phosphodiesterase